MNVLRTIIKKYRVSHVAPVFAWGLIGIMIYGGGDANDDFIWIVSGATFIVIHCAVNIWNAASREFKETDTDG